MVNSVGLLGMTLSDANKAIKKLPYGPIRVVFCSKLVSYKSLELRVSSRRSENINLARGPKPLLFGGKHREEPRSPAISNLISFVSFKFC